LYYEADADMERLKAVSCELEAIEQDFNETELLVKGYLNGSQRNISDISGSKPTGQSPRTESSRTDRRTEKLRNEITKREEEINRIAQDLERTHFECEKELNQKLMEHHQRSRQRSQQTLGAISEQSKQAKKKSQLPFMSENTKPNVELIVPQIERDFCLHGTGASSALQKSDALSKMSSMALLGITRVVSSTPNISQMSESNKVPSGVERTQDQPKVPLDLKVDNYIPTQFVTAAHSHASAGTRMEPHSLLGLTPPTTRTANQLSRSTTDQLSADA